MPEVKSIPVAGEKPAAVAVHGLEKAYGTKDAISRALNGISFDVRDGEFVGVMGPSGSGKSTLLNCISTIDRPTAGQVLIAGQDITRLRGRDLARFRREHLGFVFQDSNLVETLSARENIALALTLQKTPSSQVDKRVDAMAARLGVDDVLDKFPNMLSGGQRQRVAAARAFVADPSLVLADEPTGALDSHSSSALLETLASMNRTHKATIMMVTHDPFAASWTRRILFIKDGRLFNELVRGDMSRAEFFDRIMDVVAFLGGKAGENHAD